MRRTRVAAAVRSAGLVLELLAVALVLVWSAAVAVAPAAAAPAPGPSPNRGRTGTYQGETSHPQHKYQVYVPPSYSDAEPAGLHLVFLEENRPADAARFASWAKHFLEPHNLIGINMQYLDGEYRKDAPAKAAAALEAIARTAADYKVIVGRGAVASFGMGGVLHVGLMQQLGKAGSPSPFTQSSLYGSFYAADPMAAPRMAWFLGVGTAEWDFGRVQVTGTGSTAPGQSTALSESGVGYRMLGRARQLYAAAAKGAGADFYFKVTKDKGHSIADAEVADAAAQFRRSDLAMAPFLYAPDYPEPALRPIVRSANALALGQAAAALERLLADEKTDSALKTKAEDVKRRLDARIEAVLALAKDLLVQDPALAAYYGNLWVQQLGAHARAAELKEALATARAKPEFQAALSVTAAFWANFSTAIFASGPSPEGVKLLAEIRARCPETSLVGKMAVELPALTTR